MMLLSQATHDSSTYRAIASWADVCDRVTASRHDSSAASDDKQVCLC